MADVPAGFVPDPSPAPAGFVPDPQPSGDFVRYPWRRPDFTATAQIPTAAELAAAQTPEQRVAVLSRTPVGQDLQKIKDLVNLWGTSGPHAVVQGLKDVAAGNYSKGAHEAITGAGITAAPMMAPALITSAIAAPVATGLTVAGGVGGGYLGQQVAQTGAAALGATSDQTALAGDVGMIGGGYAGAKVGNLLAARVAGTGLPTPKGRARAESDILSAVPPSTSTPYTPAQLNRARPYLEAVHTSDPITSVESFRDAADTAVGDIETHIRQYVQAHAGQTIETDPMADAKKVLENSPRTDAVKSGLQELKSLNLDRPLSLPDAEALREQLNAENKGILKRNNYDVAIARKVDPGFAAREAAAASLRNGIYSKLEDLGIPGVADLRRDEGALIAVRNASQRQIFSGAKNVPGQQPGAIRQVGALAVRATPLPAVVSDPLAKVIAGSPMTRDAMIERAFRQVLTTGPVYPAVTAGAATGTEGP